MLPVSDAAIISSHVDATLVVVRLAGSTDRICVSSRGSWTRASHRNWGSSLPARIRSTSTERTARFRIPPAASPSERVPRQQSPFIRRRIALPARTRATPGAGPDRPPYSASETRLGSRSRDSTARGVRLAGGTSRARSQDGLQIDSRSPDRIRAHYEIERELSDSLREAPATAVSLCTARSTTRSSSVARSSDAMPCCRWNGPRRQCRSRVGISASVSSSRHIISRTGGWRLCPLQKGCDDSGRRLRSGRVGIPHGGCKRQR